MTSSSHNFFIRFLPPAVIFGILTVLDQISKTAAKNTLPGHPLYLIPGVIHLEYVENRGAAFGILQGKQVVFIAVTLLFLTGIAVLLTKIPAGKKYNPARFFLVMLSAGAFGNLLDRIRLNYVRDFIYFVPIDFPVFNLADVYVVLSAFSLVLMMLFFYKEEDLEFLHPGGAS